MKTDNTETIETTGLTQTYKKATSCGSLYIAIIYKDLEPEMIDYIKIYWSNRTGDCGSSFQEAFADLLTFSVRRIRNKHEAIAIVKNLRDHSCNKQTPNHEHIRSCSDAIGMVIQKALNVTDDELRGR